MRDSNAQKVNSTLVPYQSQRVEALAPDHIVRRRLTPPLDHTAQVPELSRKGDGRPWDRVGNAGAAVSAHMDQVSSPTPPPPEYLFHAKSKDVTARDDNPDTQK